MDRLNKNIKTFQSKAFKRNPRPFQALLPLKRGKREGEVSFC
jgi:hypothetical protein